MNAPFGYARQIDSFEQIPDLIADFERMGCGFRVPPLQALYAGRIAYLDIHRRTPGKLVKEWIAAVRLPALAIIGDDQGWGIAPSGPAGIPQAERLLRWARFIAIHGAGGQREDYVEAVRTTTALRRVVMIECNSDQVGTWHAAAKRWAPRTPGIQILASGDGIHPIRGTLQ